ncbi:MAG: glycoside hydrolase family 31 protein [Capsulimonadaceae bacterium]|nr:glycoside hydrolase family 31 protein [Capsulimonadaceae bacterium]
MNKIYTKAIRLAIYAIVIACGAVQCANADNNGVVTVGKARFTVIGPNIIRIEYSDAGKFVDLPSTFAINRDARWSGAAVVASATQTVIDTGAIRLVYTPDGAPLNATNLTARIKIGSDSAQWVPGQTDPGNLGGTIRTLDGAIAAKSLGNGAISRSGWALIDDSASPLLAEGWVKARPDKTNIDWYLLGYGHDYRAALHALTTISGTVPLPRRYALGVWYSRYWPYSSTEYREIVQEYRDHDFPLDNIVLDMDWHKDGWTGWSWNRKLLPDADDLLNWFHDQGLHVTVNLHPADGVAPHEDQYAAFMTALGQDPASGKTVPFDAASKPYMDALTKTVLDPLTKEGIDFWWLDWQQYEKTRSLPELTNLFWLNTLLYDQTASGGQRGLSFSRWAGWGDHRHPIHFSGDANTGFPMLTFEVPFTATAGNVGCFFWSHDIGGHMGGRNEESYARWCQFGATSPVLRSHSTRSKEMDRRPWTYSKWAEDSMRISFHLRSELFPYIYTSAAESCRESVPLDRPLYFDYPEADNAYHNGQEYLLGDNLLAAPITKAGAGDGKVASQIVWLPSDSAWYNWFTGERIAGGSEILATATIDESPLYARGGVPIPLQPYAMRMASAPLSTLVVRCYPGEDGKTGRSTLYEDDGITNGYARGESATTNLSYLRRGNTVTVTIAPAAGTFTGQPVQRAYKIILPDTDPGENAVADGKPVACQYDAGAFTNEIDLPPSSIRQAMTLTITARPAGFDALAVLARNQRLEAIGGKALDGDTLGDVLDTHAFRDLDPSSREEALAVFGIGVVRHNEQNYLYGQDEPAYAFVHPMTVDHDELTYTPQVSMMDQNTKPFTTTRTGCFEFPAGAGTTLVSGTAKGKPFSLLYSWLPLDSDHDLARKAHVTVSSTQEGYGAAGINDGVIDGYPGNKAREWASNGEKAGAWARLEWGAPVELNAIALYDRPNTVDQVTSGTIEFSDGSSQTFGALPDGGQMPLIVTFSPRTVSWFKVTIGGVKPRTENAGFAEIAAYGRAVK